MSSVVKMEGAGKTYPTPSGPLEVLRDVDFEVSEGDFVMLTGPSGSGKSTLLHLAALLDEVSCGKLWLDGEEVSRADENDLTRLRMNKIGMVFQKFCLLPHRSALDNILFRYRYIPDHPHDLEAQAMELAKRLGIDHIIRNPARLLSGGEMQRVAIARAMLLRPRLLVSDEPTGNLDPESSKTVMECFRQLNREGITVLMVTHNLGLLDYADRQVHCDNKTLVEVD